MCTCHACACHVCAGSYVCIPCVCMLMYVYAIYVRTHVCVCHVLTWRPGPSMGLLYQASLYSWSQDSLNLGVLSCLHPATARVLQGALWPCLTFYVNSGIKFRSFCLCDRHLTEWVTSPACQCPLLLVHRKGAPYSWSHLTLLEEWHSSDRREIWKAPWKQGWWTISVIQNSGIQEQPPPLYTYFHVNLGSVRPCQKQIKQTNKQTTRTGV